MVVRGPAEAARIDAFFVFFHDTFKRAPQTFTLRASEFRVPPAGLLDAANLTAQSREDLQQRRHEHYPDGWMRTADGDPKGDPVTCRRELAAAPAAAAGLRRRWGPGGYGMRSEIAASNPAAVGI